MYSELSPSPFLVGPPAPAFGEQESKRKVCLNVSGGRLFFFTFFLKKIPFFKSLGISMNRVCKLWRFGKVSACFNLGFWKPVARKLPVSSFRSSSNLFLDFQQCQRQCECIWMGWSAGVLVCCDQRGWRLVRGCSLISTKLWKLPFNSRTHQMHNCRPHDTIFEREHLRRVNWTKCDQ